MLVADDSIRLHRLRSCDVPQSLRTVALGEGVGFFTYETIGECKGPFLVTSPQAPSSLDELKVALQVELSRYFETLYPQIFELRDVLLFPRPPNLPLLSSIGGIHTSIKDSLLAPAVKKQSSRQACNTSSTDLSLPYPSHSSASPQPSTEHSRIDNLTIFARTSDEQDHDPYPMTVIRQVLSVYANPPPGVARDLSNVLEVDVFIECISSWRHPLRDRRRLLDTLSRLQGRAPTVLFCMASPNRFTRRLDEVQLLRQLCPDVKIWSTGIHDTQDPMSRAQQRKIWRRILTGADERMDLLLQRSLQDALILSEEHALYTDQALAMDRPLFAAVRGDEPKLFHDFRRGLAALAHARGLGRAVLITRTSLKSTNSLRRQRELLRLLAPSGLDLVDLALSDLSAYTGKGIAEPLDDPLLADSLVLVTSVDRIARSYDHLAQVAEVATRRRQVIVATVWSPITEEEELMRAAKDLDGEENGPVSAYLTSIGSQSRSCKALPIILPNVVAASPPFSTPQVALNSVGRAARFVNSFVDSQYQGDTTLYIPPHLIVPKGVSRTIEQDLRDYLITSFPSTPIPSILVLRKDFTCSCVDSKDAHDLDCACDCEWCRVRREEICPSRFTSNLVCPELCNCRCAEHHNSSLPVSCCRPELLILNGFG